LEVTKSRDVNIAYKLNQRKIEEITEIIKDVSDEIEYNATCIEGTSIKFASLDEFIKYPNRREKQYNTIEIVNSYRSLVRISIIFSNREFCPITYRITGDESKVDTYAGQIEGFTRSLRQWYSFIGVMNKYRFIITVAVISFTLLIISNLYNKDLPFWAWFPIGFLIVVSFDKVKSLLFPVATFELGDGIERAKTHDNIRNLVLSGVFLAAIVGYIVNQIPGI